MLDLFEQRSVPTDIILQNDLGYRQKKITLLRLLYYPLATHQEFPRPRKTPLIEGRRSATLTHKTKFYFWQKYLVRLMHTASAVFAA